MMCWEVEGMRCGVNHRCFVNASESPVEGDCLEKPSSKIDGFCLKANIREKNIDTIFADKKEDFIPY